MDVVHIVPTTLLHSLEGMEGLDWGKLIKLQGVGGSFLFSPASTASAFMNTKDENCLEYLKKTVGRFNGGVPGTCPVDLFEHIWAVDCLERLGVSRYFQANIKEIINCLLRYWTEHEIAWARHSNVRDIDDTTMGFRLLRLHGHNVSPDVFQHFFSACFRNKNCEFRAIVCKHVGHGTNFIVECLAILESVEYTLYSNSCIWWFKCAKVNKAKMA